MTTNEITCFIVAVLMKKLPDKKRDIETCEKIFEDALSILKSFTFSNMQEQR